MQQMSRKQIHANKLFTVDEEVKNLAAIPNNEHLIKENATFHSKAKNKTVIKSQNENKTFG